MYAIVNLYSNKLGEISKFLSSFYNNEIIINNDFKWERTYNNPIEIADIISSLIDNNEKYQINIWISLDEGVFINITDYNVNNVIKYLFERYPY